MMYMDRLCAADTYNACVHGRPNLPVQDFHVHNIVPRTLKALLQTVLLD